MQGGQITREWVFTTAQTDLKIVDVTSAQQFAPIDLIVIAANSNSVDVSLRMGTSTGSTLPAFTNNSATGVAGIFFYHPAIAKGGGAAILGGKEAFAAAGDPDADVLLTCSIASGGSITVVLTYRLLDVA